MAKAINLMSHDSHYFIVNNESNLSLIIKLLIENTISTKKIDYKFKDVKFIDFS